MAQFFEMPQASPTMEVGTILSWRKSEGDALAPQDVLAEVETDKAAMEIEIFDNGYLLKILEHEGAEVPAGKPIAILGSSPDEDITELVASFEALKDAPAAFSRKDAATAAGLRPSSSTARFICCMEPASIVPARAAMAAVEDMPTCGHRFHAECVLALQRQGVNNLCPLCRQGR